MAITVANIIAGPLSVYSGDEGETLPELDDLAALAVTPGADWTLEGAHMNDKDFECVYEPEFEGVRVMEHLADVAAPLVGEAGWLEYALAEKDLTAYKQAMAAGTLATTAAGESQTAQDKLGVGDGTATIVSLLLLGTNPEGGSRVIHVFRAIQTGPVKFLHGRKHRGHDVRWKFLDDPSQTAGERLFKIYDITGVVAE